MPETNWIAQSGANIERAIAERWGIDVNDPATLPGLCSYLQDALAPPNLKIAGPLVRTIIRAIEVRYIREEEPLPRNLKACLTWLNERLFVLRYPSFPKEWTYADKEALPTGEDKPKVKPCRTNPRMYLKRGQL